MLDEETFDNTHRMVQTLIQEFEGHDCPGCVADYVTEHLPKDLDTVLAAFNVALFGYLQAGLTDEERLRVYCKECHTTITAESEGELDALMAEHESLFHQ